MQADGILRSARPRHPLLPRQARNSPTLRWVPVAPETLRHGGAMNHPEGGPEGTTDTQAGAFRSVLVATDLSAESDALVRAGAEIAARSRGALHVVHSADVLSAGHPGKPRSFEERIASAEHALGEQIRRCVPSTVRATHHAGASAPEITIVEQVHRHAADLVVLGPHAGSAAPGRLLGTTAERVLGGAGTPCLVVRNPIPATSHHVAAAVDPKHRVRQVLDAAVRWAIQLGGPADAPRPVRLTALYVTGDRGGDLPATLDRMLRDAVEASGGGGRVDATVEVRGTDVVESIVLFAEAEATDLLVMSTHNRGILGRALLGSVSAAVTRRAPCNVLLVPS